MDSIFAQLDDWALASDGIRRTRRSGPYWKATSFVRSTRDILARCMREKGVGAETARFLLAGLPDTFDEWNQPRATPQGHPGGPQIYEVANV